MAGASSGYQPFALSLLVLVLLALFYLFVGRGGRKTMSDKGRLGDLRKGGRGWGGGGYGNGAGEDDV